MKFLLTLIVCAAVAGCAHPPKRTPPLAAPLSAPGISGDVGFYHTVQRKQTLYRIAKNYNLDWHELMRLNRVSNPGQLEVGQRLFIPYRRRPETHMPATAGPMGYEDIRRLVGPRSPGSDWRTITVHHSGTSAGNAALFDRDHMRRHMGGLFYHFVIGNGSRSPSGGLEVGFRWQRQIPANRPYDIQICLVGNFDEQYVSEAQFSTLVSLIRILREDYGIPVGCIRKHEDIKGKHTDCPGKHFPFERLLTDLMRR